MTTSFPDQVYINHLREALWQQSTSFASVMVGAGFSLNAMPIRAGISSMPTWTELVHKLIDDLYPDNDEDASYHRSEKLKSSSATSAMLRLAEEYQIAFGRTRLDAQLMQYVPDLSFEPSKLHKDLLSLKWRDVFTTNWDTLLERAAQQSPERGYQIVATPGDIARSAQPRIVKLHGSFPNIRPFIVTEEDYRSYPQKMAPFVNLVRQTAMECVLCLIGFSGSDPNFLAWIGWVRDQLGPHQPRIFLVTLNRNSSAERQLLESIGIRLIDLSRLPGAETLPGPQGAQRSLDWFFRNLREGKAQTDPRDWPLSRQRSPLRANDLATIPPATDSGFPGFPAPGSGSMDLAWTINVVLIWRQARLCYPGWLVMPQATRDRVVKDLSSTIFTVQRNLAEASIVVRLIAYRELVWQLNVCHLPSPESISQSILETLERIRSTLVSLNPEALVCAPRMHELLPALRVSVSYATTDSKLKEAFQELDAAWIELNFALLRQAREEGNAKLFGEFIEILRADSVCAPSLKARLAYEQCLLATGRVDRKALLAAIQAWGDDDAHDPYYGVLRAGVLAESGQIVEAERLCARSIDMLRKRRIPGEDDLASRSRECWALVLYINLRATRSFQTPEFVGDETFQTDQRALEDRLQNTELIGDPWAELKSLANTLKSHNLEQKARARSPDSLSSSRWLACLPSLQALRLTDDVGLPAEVGNSLITRRLRLQAVNSLRPYSRSLATTAFLRIGTVKDHFSEVNLFDPVWIARLRPLDAEELSQRVGQLLNVSIGRYRAERSIDRLASHYWMDRAKFAAQLQGSLVTRLKPERIEAIFGEIADYFKQGQVDHIWLQDSFTFLFQEALNALPLERLPEFLVQVLTFPYRPNDAPFPWPSPLLAFQHPSSRSVRSSLGHEIEQKINTLIQDCFNHENNVRSEALLRLAILYSNGILTSNEEARFGEALWSQVDERGLPKNDCVSDDAFLSLPEPVVNKADLALRKAYLWNVNPFNLPNALNDSRDFRLLANSLNAICDFNPRATARGSQFDINHIEAHALVGRLINIYNILAETRKGDIFGFDRDGLLRLIQTAIAEAGIPHIDAADQGIAKYIQHNIDKWQAAEEPHLEAAISATRLHFSSSDRLIADLNRQARSHRPFVANPALQAIGRWCRRWSEWNIRKPPHHIAIAIATIIEDRWPPVLSSALAAALALVRNHHEYLDEEVTGPLFAGLLTLADETDYERVDLMGIEGIEPDKIPDIRAGCVRVAAAVASAGKTGDAIERWTKIAESDPLSQVRHAS